MSCQTTVSHFLEQNFPRSRLARVQICCGWSTSDLWQMCKGYRFSTATYEFLATEDTNRDRVNDILFVLRSSEGSQNNTCTGAGMASSSHLITQKVASVCVLSKLLSSLYFFRSTIAMCVFHSSGWDRWKWPVGVSVVPRISLGSVWSESGCK